mgnify:CR=1 FL=1
MDITHAIALRYAKQMKLFERDGRIHYGMWRRWLRAANKSEADAIVRGFVLVNRSRRRGDVRR